MRVLLTVALILITVPSYAQCVAEVKDVIQDEARGSIIVQTEYILNGKVVQQGQTRYTEDSGTNAEIIALVKKDIEEHCKNLIRRIEANQIYKNEQSLLIQKAKTTPIITSIKGDLIGQKKTVSEVTDTFKDKEIKVTYDSKNITTDSVSVTP